MLSPLEYDACLSAILELNRGKATCIRVSRGDVTDFCSSSHLRYNSRVDVNGHNLSIQIGDAPNRGGANSSCSEIGGEMNTFWQLPANTTFTVQ
jgi:hypothetical protein